MSHDDRADLVCSYCKRASADFRDFGSSEFRICAECLACSFCKKALADVQKLIAGPRALICDECVDLCADIVEEELVGERLVWVGKDLATASDLERRATTLSVRAQRLAASCDEAVALPRPVAERARALAGEIEALVRGQLGG